MEQKASMQITKGYFDFIHCLTNSLSLSTCHYCSSVLAKVRACGNFKQLSYNVYEPYNFFRKVSSPRKSNQVVIGKVFDIYFAPRQKRLAARPSLDPTRNSFLCLFSLPRLRSNEWVRKQEPIKISDLYVDNNLISRDNLLRYHLVKA